MNRILFTLIVPLLFSPLLLSQETSVIFNARYMPEKEYTTIQSSIITGSMDFKVDKKTRKVLEETGISLPMKMSSKNESETITRTGSLKGDSFPVIVRYDKSTSSSKVADKIQTEEESPFTKCIIYGLYNNNSINIDSITGENLNEAQKALLAKTIESVQSLIRFPEHPLKVGESFTQKMPLTLPIPGVENAEILVVSKYKLTKIANGKAYFDLQQKLAFNMAEKSTEMKLKGGGKGKAEYDIANNIISYTQSDILVKMKMKIEDMKAKAQFSTDTKQEISIRPAPADEQLPEMTKSEGNNGQISLYNRQWTLTELNGKSMENLSPVMGLIFIHFSESDNNISGSGGCNRFFGKYEEREGGWITLSDIGMTKKACPDMSIEEELTQVLKSVNRYTLEGDTLILKKGGKIPVAKFRYIFNEPEITIL